MASRGINKVILVGHLGQDRTCVICQTAAQWQT
jgi:single-stranded DNA-binding protein